MGEKLLKAPPGKEVRERFCRSLLNEIIGNGLSREAAASVLRSFTLALDWQVIIACENAASDKGENEGAKPTPQPVVTGSSCPHAHIDFSACRCRDCDQLLYGIYNDNGYLPYESMRKREHEVVLASVRERCAGLFLVLPDHITAIGDDCFSEQEELEEVVLPASLHSIGRYAFYACPALKSIKVPETVTSIGEAAFRGLKRVYYDGPAAGAPCGAKEHIVSTNAALRSKDTPATYSQTFEADSEALLRTAYVDKKVGERFEFGRYPQGPNGEVKPVTWRVLRRVGDSLLVISERALDAKPYNEDWRPITWSECSLRRWLNGEFLEKAFNEGERSLIKTSRLVNNAGPATEDRVFLLSIDEAKSLFADSFDRTVRPADYAVENGVYTNDKGTAWWWLRSRGDSHHSAARVDTSGGVRYFISSAYHSFGSVRPAIRLAL